MPKNMILEGLQRAIQAEVEGHHFYLMAAASTTDEQGKNIFETLAHEELEHAQFLRSQHGAFLKTGRPDPVARLGRPSTLIGPSPIFSPKLRERIREAHFEMTALSIGIQLELSAIAFYRGQASEAQDQGVRAFFSELADWENGHYQALLRQQESLKDDYWSSSGFSPF
jgi:rubrerythrin